MENDGLPTAQELQNPEETFRLFLTSSFDVVYKMSADWHYMYQLVGHAFLRDTQASAETWMTAYVPAPQRPQMWAWIKEAIHHQRVFEHEHQVFRADGSVGWVYSRAVPVRNAQGVIAEWLGTSVSTSPHRKEERLRQQQQQALFMAVQEAEEVERKRMAESLHNGIGQMLYAVKLRLEQSRVLIPAATKAIRALRQETDDLLADAIRQVRSLSHELVPAVLEEFGLSSALQSLCRNTRGARLRIDCQLQLDAALPPLSTPLQLALYRIAQELLQNVIKHAAGATYASMEMENVPGFVLLRVEDDGPGFIAAPLATTGLGLRSIRDRVALLGGVIDEGNVPGAGAYVRIRLPVSAEQAPV